MKLQGKRFLVIGGAGFIGSHTVDQLLKHDVKEIIIYDDFSRGSRLNLQQALLDPRVRVFDLGGDILKPDILAKAVTGCDGVFHFAAMWLLHCHDFPHSAFQTNIAGTFNVLDACVKSGVKKLVFSSSASVYGDALSEPMDESHPLNNKTFYGATKIAGEAMLTAYHHRYDLNFVGLRYMNVYGVRQDYKGAYISVIMRMLDAIDAHKPLTIYGDGTEAFDFVNVEDCASANICAMQSKINNTLLNVGTGSKTTLNDLALMLLDLTKSNLPIVYSPNENKTLVKSRIGSITKAQNDIDFTAKVNLKNGLERLIDWRRSQKLAN